MTTDRTHEPSQDAHGTARHLKSSANRDLGELVARARSDWSNSSISPGLWANRHGPTLLDALAASEARAEALDKLRGNESFVRISAERLAEHHAARADKAEAEVAGLKADAEAALSDLELFRLAVEANDPKRELLERVKMLKELFDPSADELHTAVSGEGK